MIAHRLVEPRSHDSLEGAPRSIRLGAPAFAAIAKSHLFRNHNTHRINHKMNQMESLSTTDAENLNVLLNYRQSSVEIPALRTVHDRSPRI